MGKVINIIGEKAARTYRIAAEETGRITKILKLKAQMADDKGKIRNIYEKIGKKVYEDYVEGKLEISMSTARQASEKDDKYNDQNRKVQNKGEVANQYEISEDIKQDCIEITNIADEVENIRMQILKLNDLKQCPKCNYEIELEFTYCPNCGEKQEMPDEAKQNDGPATIVTTDSTDSILTKEKDNNNPRSKNVKNFKDDISKNIENSNKDTSQKDSE